MEIAEPGKQRAIDVRLVKTGGRETVAGTDSSLGDWLRRLFPTPVVATPPVEPIIVVNVKRADRYVGEFRLHSDLTRAGVIDEISSYGAVDAIELRVVEAGASPAQQIESGILAANSLDIETRLLISD